jgi:hypothetical protein
MIARAPVVLILAALADPAAAQRPDPVPTALEAFVAATSVVVRTETLVETIDSADATLEVFVLVAEDTAHPSERLRGARLRLRNNSALDDVYLDEAQLSKLRGALWVMGDFVEEPGPSATVLPGNVHGTADCWMPDPPVRILCPEYATYQNFAGMSLGALGGPGFRFPARKPAAIQQAIERAIAELERL